MFKLATLTAALTLAGCASLTSGPPTLEEAWVTDGFAAPESVALSEDGSFLYVSNVSGEGAEKDGDGFISKITLDGELIERRWAEGLNGPKGLALSEDGLLWISDIDQLVAVDATTGALQQSHEIAEAVFLNYAAVLPDGTVLVADSGGAKIYGFDGKTVSIWLEDDTLQSINGLLPRGDDLLVTTMDGLLLTVDIATKAPTVLASDLGQGDGVAVTRGGFLVSHWPGRIMHVSNDGEATVLLDTEAEGTFQNDLILLGNTVIVPNWQPGTVTAWTIR
ncbi:MAG: hypothetical protein AAFW65_04070 [Pseudomonadota bacterium]